jgi:hypothetical protein
MNRILKHIIENRFNYCHAIEVECKYDLISVIDNIYDEFIRDYSHKEVLEFINSLEVYCLDDKEEEEVFNFNINNYLIENYG